MKIENPKVRKWLKVTAWTLMCAVLFVVGMFLGLVQILQPSVLTPLAEKVLTSQLRAQVKMERMELSFNGNFPHLTLQIDKMAVLSDDILNLSKEERAELPAYADTVIALDRFTGELNVTSLMGKTVKIGDITLDGPSFNIVDVREGLCNYDIFYPDEDTTAVKLPNMELRQFAIVNPKTMRYHNLDTETYAEFNLAKASLDGQKAPYYKLELTGNALSPEWEAFGLGDMAFGLDGTVKYDFARPSRFGLKNFHVWLDILKMDVSTDIDLADGVIVNSLDFRLNALPMSTLLGYVPEDFRDMLGLLPLKTDAKLTLQAVLNKPWNPTVDFFPWMDLTVTVPKCTFEYDDFKLREASLDATLRVKGDDLDAAVLDIKNLTVKGRDEGLDLTLSGTVKDMVSDPKVDFKVKGRADLAKMPWLPPLIKSDIEGKITADADIRGAQSMMTRQGFHRLYASGSVDVRDFYAASWDTTLMVAFDRARFEFGTDETFSHGEYRATDLLSLRAEIDSCAVLSDDISMKFTGFKAGIGAENKAGSADTTRVNPIGGTIKAKMFTLETLTDSMGVVIRDALIYGSMTRYRDKAREPLFVLHVKADKCAAGTPEGRLLFSGAQTTFTAHRRDKGRRAEKIRRTADSLSVAYPSLPPDSIYRLALEHHQKGRHGKRFTESRLADGAEVVDFNIASGFARFLRDWDMTGDLKARRAAFYTPTFPLRNRMRDINIRYSDDSLKFDNVLYRVGRSDMTFSGLVTNMRRAFLSRFKRPIKLSLDIRSDTIDINEIADAFFRGAAYADGKTKKRLDLGEMTDEGAMEKAVDKTTSGEAAGPFLIPVNLDANLRVRSNHVLYSDAVLDDFGGDLLIYNGALNLDNLRASSPVGSVKLSALYSAPEADDMTFAMGLQLNGFNIERFLKMVPVIDSVMPMMRDIGGIVDVDIAATTPVDRQMNFVLPSLKAAIKVKGDSLTVLDPETFKTMAKWLMFKNKNKNMIDSLTAQLLVENNMLKIYPFIFNFDRYKLGVMGWMSLDDKYEYHVGVLKSPIPFKFGINIKGDGDKMKIRLGGNKINKKNIEAHSLAIVDTTRVNLINEIKQVFRRGIRGAKLGSVAMAPRPEATTINLDADTLTAADSLRFIQEGLIPAPEKPLPMPEEEIKGKKKNKKKKKDESQKRNAAVVIRRNDGSVS